MDMDESGAHKMTYREKLLAIGTVQLCGLVDLYRAEQVVIDADAEIAGLVGDRNSLRDFANAVMESWPHGDVDGCYLERMAVDHGLLALKEPKPTEPCGEGCACSGYPTPEEWAEGIDCYVRTPLLTGKIDAARANGGEG